MRVLIQYPGVDDEKPAMLEVEADTLRELFIIINEAGKILWGNRAKQVDVTVYGDSKMTEDEVRAFLDWKKNQ
jgi:hypothetical protein